MTIVHIVLATFKPDVGQDVIESTCQHFLSLKDQCVHPETKKPYLRSVVGGRDNSPEGLSNGITHAFVIEFESEEDRKYYLEQDPAHLAFVQSIGAVVERIQVVDFTPGVL
ncbi:stress responsive A/B barrel domain protein [Thermoascus aurantiacus ATCC 26904]